MSNLVKKLRYLGDHASFEPHMYHVAADAIQRLQYIVTVLTISSLLLLLTVIRLVN